MIFNILDNTTELWMTKYIIGEIFSFSGATLYKNHSDQTVIARSSLVEVSHYYQLGKNKMDILYNEKSQNVGLSISLLSFEKIFKLKKKIHSKIANVGKG